MSKKNYFVDTKNRSDRLASGPIFRPLGFVKTLVLKMFTTWPKSCSRRPKTVQNDSKMLRD